MDHEFLIVEFRLNLKKVWKSTRPFRYDLNQIPYGYTVVMNRFKVLDLVISVSKKLWTKVHNIVQEVVTKTIPKKNNCEKAKWLPGEAFKTAENIRELNSKQERERLPSEMQTSRK